MKKIEAKEQTLSQILSNTKYSIDYYQREYLWEREQVLDLLDDLCKKFLDTHDSNKMLRQVASQYERYFVGSVIICDNGEKKYIVDGQQRLTTLTLLLIYLRHRLVNIQETASHIESLISTYIPPEHSFVLDVDERKGCMEALYSDENEFDGSNESESIRNIMARYQDIVESFPHEITDRSVLYFSSWLIYNVDLIKIVSYSSDDAYSIFETMNDRGLSLTSTDMLKGYLLTKITDSESRNIANEVWRNRISDLKKIGKNEDSHSITAWLRSQHAISIREKHKEADDKDFELIATQCHRWVGTNSHSLKLFDSNDYFEFIDNNFLFYTQWYMFIRNKSMKLSSDFPHIFYNAQNNFTLQYPVLLAPLCADDTEDIIAKKIWITSVYLDIILARRIWNNRQITQNTMRYSMYKSVILEIRNKKISDLCDYFVDNLEKDRDKFTSNPNLRLNRQNKWKLHRILARIADYLEKGVGNSSKYWDFTERDNDPYEIEHIWANHFKKHGHDNDFSELDFQEYRNRIGGLLLLPKSFNASYGDLYYSRKVEHYRNNDLLAASLNEDTFQNNPALHNFISETGLNLKPYNEFTKKDLDERQELYIQIAEKVWNVDNLRI